MQEYLDNGVKLGWLIEPSVKTVEIYRHNKQVEILKQTMKETVWGNADGEYGEVDISTQIERIETDYNKLKETIRKQFAETTNGKKQIIK